VPFGSVPLRSDRWSSSIYGAFKAINCFRLRYAPLSYLTFNQVVLGSSPSRLTNRIKGFLL
jgi:hypothetical protein